ncbi:hypothetical protein H8356DRAFT_1420109 [Neocallimastix lanati (nom. inval.)]|nr:hypothetical protein H8356DRAFT_1420109 [Neocallimastix sp. JGI-2020a]
MSTLYPDIDKLYCYREFTEVNSNDPLIEEKAHMKYMCADNNAIKRFLIYHSPGTGKSFTALWIHLNFIRAQPIGCEEKNNFVIIRGLKAS